MKKFKLWSGLGLAFIAIVTFSLSIFLAKPSDAVSVRNAQMIELGIIDEVKSAEELGLGHLLRRPPQLVADLMDNIRTAHGMVQSTDNLSMAIPLNTHSPVGRLVNDPGSDPRLSNLLAVGSVNNAGQAEPITPGQEAEMFAQEARGGGTLDPVKEIPRTSLNKLGETLIADASGRFSQARKTRVFDLIVFNKRNRRTYLVPNVIADSFCRDALNAVLNGTQKPHNINLNRLRRV